MSENTRPPAIPFDSDLARRADTPRYGVDRAISAVAYHAGPEIVVTTVAGGAGALLVHPAALPVVAALVAVYAAADRITRRRRIDAHRVQSSALRHSAHRNALKSPASLPVRQTLRGCPKTTRTRLYGQTRPQSDGHVDDFPSPLARSNTVGEVRAVTDHPPASLPRGSRRPARRQPGGASPRSVNRKDSYESFLFRSERKVLTSVPSL